MPRITEEERKRRNVEANRRWRQANRERQRAYFKARYDADPARAKEEQRLHRERHRDRARARSLVGKHLERGKIVRPDRCESCGADSRPDAHHPDYSKPLDVQWLCHDCHKTADKLRSSATEDGRTREARRSVRPSRAA